MGININGIDQSNIILNTIYITYPILVQISLPNIRPVKLSSNPIRLPIHRSFLNKGIQMSLCKHHRWELPGNYPVLIVVMVIYH